VDIRSSIVHARYTIEKILEKEMVCAIMWLLLGATTNLSFQSNPGNYSLKCDGPQKKQIPYLPEDDKLLIQLKETKKLTWD
jgi:hypothetical protein